MIRRMGTGCTHGLMADDTRVKSRLEKHKALALLPGRAVLNMRAASKRIRDMVRVPSLHPVVRNTKEVGSKTKNTATAAMSGHMEQSTKAHS